MSKKLAKTVLSAAMAGVLFGVSFDIMAADDKGEGSASALTAAGTAESIYKYSVYQSGQDQKADKLSSQKFYIKYNPDTKEAKIYFGANPDQVKMANKELYAINTSGNVVVKSDDGKLSFSYYDKDVHDFMNSMGSSKGVHNMSEDEIRSLINRVEAIKKISVNTDAVLDPLLKIEGYKSAVGKDARATHENSVALGADSVTTRDNEVYIGYKTENGKAYGTRVLGGLSDGTSNSDAATVGQLNRKVDVVYDDVKARITVESEKQKKYTDRRPARLTKKLKPAQRLVLIPTENLPVQKVRLKLSPSMTVSLLCLAEQTVLIMQLVPLMAVSPVTRNPLRKTARRLQPIPVRCSNIQHVWTASSARLMKTIRK